MQQHQTLRGIIFVIAGLTVFSLQDLILKLISGDFPLYEAMVIRGFTSLPILVLFAMRDGGLRTLFTKGVWQMVVRGAVISFAYFSFYIALAGLPLPTTVALYFSAPLFITILSVLFLHEQVSPLTWIAVLIGFVGVLIIVRPGSDLFDWASLLPVLSGLTYAIAMVAARSMGARETATALAFWGNFVFLSFALLMALFLHSGNHTITTHPSLGFLTRGWLTPDLRSLALMMACGVIAAIGVWLLTQAYRVAAASTVAPFEYTGVMWSLLWGWIFWHDWPDTSGWIGTAFIVGSGLMVVYNARRQPQSDPAQ